MEMNAQDTHETNVLELLSQLDDYLIIKILLEMDPIQMTILGGTCWQYYRLTSDRKVWRQIIERHGLTDALLKRRGGNANLKRIRVMQKTYVAHLIEQAKEIEQRKKEMNYIPSLQNVVWKRLANAILYSMLYKDQNPCLHTTIIYIREYEKVRCPNCASFSFTNFASGSYLAEYLRVTKQMYAEQVTFTHDPKYD